MRLGSHPPRDALLKDDRTDGVEDRRGKELNQQQLDDAVQRLLAVAEDIGAVVRSSPISGG